MLLGKCWTSRTTTGRSDTPIVSALDTPSISERADPFLSRRQNVKVLYPDFPRPNVPFAGLENAYCSNVFRFHLGDISLLIHP